MNKLLLNYNPIIIIRDFEQALKAGYRFLPGTSSLTEFPSGLMELNLVKQDVVIPDVSYEDVLGIVHVVEHDKTEYLLSLQRLIVNEYELDLNSVVYDMLGTKRAKLVRPDHPSLKQYTKEELDSLSWDEIKYIGRVRQVFNKNRDVMTTQILKFQENSV